MRTCSDFRYRIEEAVLDEIAFSGLFAAIARKAPTHEQRQIIESVCEDDEAHARIFAAFLSGGKMPVCHPVRLPDTKDDFLTLIKNAVSMKLASQRRYSLFADYAPTQAARYILLSVMHEEAHHVRILEALQESSCALPENTPASE